MCMKSVATPRFQVADLCHYGIFPRIVSISHPDHQGWSIMGCFSKRYVVGYSQVPLQRGLVYHDIAYDTAWQKVNQILES